MSYLEICRLCLQRTDVYQTEEVDLVKLTEIAKITQFSPLTTSELISFKGHVICHSCITNLQSLVILHDQISKSNATVESLTSKRRNGNTSLNLVQLFNNTNLYKNVHICRLCLKPTRIVAIYLYECLNTVLPYDCVIKMLGYCNLELVHLMDTFNPVLCHICWQRIQVVYAFQKNSQMVDSKVKYYCNLLVKLALDRADLEDILHMWDNLAVVDGSRNDTEIIFDSASRRACFEEHNYSKRYSDGSSDTLSATSSTCENDLDDMPLLDRVPVSVCLAPDESRKVNNRNILITSNIVLNGLHRHGNRDRRRRRKKTSVSEIERRVTRLRSNEMSIDQDDWRELLIVTKEEIIKERPQESFTRNRTNFLVDAEGPNMDLPPQLTSEIELKTKNVYAWRNTTKNKKTNSVNTIFYPSIKKDSYEELNKTNQLNSELVIKRERLSDNDDDFIEEPHILPINSHPEAMSSFLNFVPNAMIKSEPRDSDDSDGPPELELQGPCSFSSKIPTITNTFSMIDKPPIVIKRKKKNPLNLTSKARRQLQVDETPKKPPVLNIANKTKREPKEHSVEEILKENWTLAKVNKEGKISPPQVDKTLRKIPAGNIVIKAKRKLEPPQVDETPKEAPTLVTVSKTRRKSQPSQADVTLKETPAADIANKAKRKLQVDEAPKKSPTLNVANKARRKLQPPQVDEILKETPAVNRVNKAEKKLQPSQVDDTAKETPTLIIARRKSQPPQVDEMLKETPVVNMINEGENSLSHGDANPQETSVVSTISSQIEEEIQFHIGPFLSDNETSSSPPPSRTPIPIPKIPDIKQAYIWLTRCDTDPTLKLVSQHVNQPISTNNKVENTNESTETSKSTVVETEMWSLLLPVKPMPLVENEIKFTREKSKLLKDVENVEALNKQQAKKHNNDDLKALLEPFENVQKAVSLGKDQKRKTTSKLLTLLPESYKDVNDKDVVMLVKNETKSNEDEQLKLTQTDQPAKASQVPNDMQPAQKPENKCDLCDYQGSKSAQLKRHKLLRHWTSGTKLDCSQCNKKKVGANIACLKCNRQFHPACLVANQLYDTQTVCKHLTAKHCIVMTKHCVVSSESADPDDVNEPKSCEYCDRPLGGYLGCEICRQYGHYKCVYDRAMDGRTVCTHLVSLFRKMASISPQEKAKCDHCHKVIDYPVPCPNCLTFMHRQCFVANLASTCDHRDVLCYTRAVEGKKIIKKKPDDKKKCDFCGTTVNNLIPCPSCFKFMHDSCFVTDSKLATFGCRHPDIVESANINIKNGTPTYPLKASSNVVARPYILVD